MAISPQQRTAFRQGAASVLPLMVGMFPWGVVTGVAMVAAGLSRFQAVAMSILVFAGSAQLAVLPLLIAGAPLWVMLATGLLVNLRYFIYSAVLAPYFGRLTRGWRVLLSYLIVDGVFALFAGRFKAGDRVEDGHWFFLGGSVVMWAAWQSASLIGIFGGSLIPSNWSLEFAATLALIALVMPLLYDRAVVCGAVVAGGVSLACGHLPMNLGVLLAVAAGVLAGLFVTRVAPQQAAGGDRVG